MNTLEHLRRLVSFPTVTRDSNREITDYLHQMLLNWGGTCERCDYIDRNMIPKANLIAKFGSGTGGLAYFCHTDVVPADTWKHPGSGPFQLHEEAGKYYARGSCDMKGSIACLLSALENRLKSPLKSPFYFVATADEEIGYIGATRVVEESHFYEEMFLNKTCGIIGEPTELSIVYAHKGVCGIKVTSHGKAAHSSTNSGVNANLKMIPFLQEMKAIYDESIQNPEWKNSEFDPPEISCNIGINDFTYARNITPGISVCTIFLRPVPGFDVLKLTERIQNIAASLDLKYELESLAWPMHRAPDSDFVQQSLIISHQSLPRTVSYGTDGAVFKDMENLIVCGPGSIAQAHTDDEYITESQLLLGTTLYQDFLVHYC